MEFFDVKVYIDAHINDTCKFIDIIDYCKANLMERISNLSCESETPKSNHPGAKPSKSEVSSNQSVSASFKSFNPKPSMQNESTNSDELDEADIGGATNEKEINIETTKLEEEDTDNGGFEQLEDNESEPPLQGNEVYNTYNGNLANVDHSGMVYLFDYQEEKERIDINKEKEDVENFERRLQLFATMSRSISRHSKFLNLSGNQESINSVKSDSNLPFGGKVRGRSSDSSVRFFE